MFEIDAWVFLLLGLFGGFFLSFAFWYYINHRLVPEISFSPELSKRKVTFDEIGYRYQFAFKNTGKRSVVNVRIKARLCVIDPLKRGNNIENFFDIALTNNDIFELKPTQMLRFAFMLHNSSSLDGKILDRSIQDLFKSGHVTLDDVFTVYPSAYCFVQIIGTDSYSNATKVFHSKMYGKKDIRNGVFRGKALDVVAPLSTSASLEEKSPLS